MNLNEWIKQKKGTRILCYSPHKRFINYNILLKVISIKIINI